MIRYEHPLNERVRTLMRLEDLYGRALFFASEEAPAAHHAALLALFEISDVAARADLKTDILQELERQKQLLGSLRSNPAIDTNVHDPLLSDIDRVTAIWRDRRYLDRSRLKSKEVVLARAARGER